MLEPAMQRREHFGRRAVPERELPRAVPPVTKAAPLPIEPFDTLPKISELLDVQAADDDLDRELAEWKAARKIRKRSFREPWRSVSIAAGIGFAAASGLLPDSVAAIGQGVTLALTAAAFFMGYRKRRSG
jgi:hypothetical protein